MKIVNGSIATNSQTALTTLIRNGPIGYSLTDQTTNFSTFSLNGPNAQINFTLLGFYTISYVILIGREDSGYENEGYGYYVAVFSSVTGAIV